MKKIKIIFITFVLLINFLTLTLCGACFRNKEYTIQYTDDIGVHQLTVTKGMPYSLESIPYRYGYEFMGLFDENGTQYVASNGTSLSIYSNKKNIVLFPKFEAITYTVVLNYEGASSQGNRSLKVLYDSDIPELPKDLVLENKVFAGWYTEPNCKGTKIADTYGNLPLISVLNSTNFKLDDTTHSINLYAGFEIKKYTVTFVFDSNLGTEKIDVPYDTPINRVVPKTRNYKGEAGLLWSTIANDTEKKNVFNGNVTNEMTLYIAEWAPVIELNANGGDEVIPIVAREGSTVSLPTPTKSLAEFLYWETIDGNQANITEMPKSSVQLIARWQAKIEFDENGGSTVKDISEKAGTDINLPIPTKDDFVFAGWYTSNKDKYTRTKMPSEGIALKAGWYKVKHVKNTFLDKSNTSNIIYYKTPALKSAYNINFAELISEVDWTNDVTVKLNFHADIKHVSYLCSVCGEAQRVAAYNTKEHFYFYSQGVVSDAYLLGKCLVDHGNGSVNISYVTCDFDITLTVTGGMIYTALGADKLANNNDRSYAGWQMTNFWVDIEYPDTSFLYL